MSFFRLLHVSHATLYYFRFLQLYPGSSCKKLPDIWESHCGALWDSILESNHLLLHCFPHAYHCVGSHKESDDGKGTMKSSMHLVAAQWPVEFRLSWPQMVPCFAVVAVLLSLTKGLKHSKEIFGSRKPKIEARLQSDLRSPVRMKSISLQEKLGHIDNSVCPGGPCYMQGWRIYYFIGEDNWVYCSLIPLEYWHTTFSRP